MRIGEEAAAHARSRVGDLMPDDGLCLQFTRQNYPIGSLYYSAVDAWHATIQHRTGTPGGDSPPTGVPVWFKSSSPYRHVAIHVGGSEVVTTWDDQIRLVPTIAAMVPTFGPYAGWGELLNDVRVWESEEEEMTEDEVVAAVVRALGTPQGRQAVGQAIFTKDAYYQGHNPKTDKVEPWAVVHDTTYSYAVQAFERAAAADNGVAALTTALRDAGVIPAADGD